MRTTAGKLIKQGPPGTAKRDPTEKESWIIKNFGFLGQHIRRVKGRQASKLKNRWASQNGSSCCTQPDYGPEEKDADVVTLPEASGFIEEASPGASKGKRKRGPSSPSTAVRHFMTAALKSGEALEKRMKR